MLTDGERRGHQITALEQRVQQQAGHLRELRACQSELERRVRRLELAEANSETASTQAARPESEANHHGE